MGNRSTAPAGNPVWSKPCSVEPEGYGSSRRAADRIFIVFRSPVELGYCTTIPFRIDLKPGTRPIKQRAYRHNSAINAKLQVEIDEMLAAGIFRRLYSEWASPVVCVMEKNGSVRVTANLKRLNDATVVPCSVLPNIAECIDQLGGSSIFSVLDLVSGFFQAAISTRIVSL